MTGRSRRSVLAGLCAGGAALAGCAAFDGEPETTELDAAALREAVRGDPRIAPTLPVEIGDAYLDSRRSRAEERLTSVPELTPETLPNGAMREDLSRVQESARDALDDAAEAETTLAALERLRDARREASELAGAWAYVDGDLGPETLSERTGDVQNDLSAFEERWAYLGNDPVRAALVHAELEDAWGRAGAEATAEFHGDVNAVTVGEVAGDVALARALLDDAEHVYDRFRESLTEPRNRRSAFDAAVDGLRADLAPRRGPYIGDGAVSDHVEVDDLERSVAGQALDALYRSVSYHGIPETRDHPANALLDAQRLFALVSAFESLAATVERNGVDAYRVASAADVADLRSAALAALAAALDESERVGLARDLLGPDAAAVAQADAGIAGSAAAASDGATTTANPTVEAGWIRRDAATYVRVAAIARAAPSAVGRVVSTLSE